MKKIFKFFPLLILILGCANSEVVEQNVDDSIEGVEGVQPAAVDNSPISVEESVRIVFVCAALMHSRFWTLLVA